MTVHCSVHLNTLSKFASVVLKASVDENMLGWIANKRVLLTLYLFTILFVPNWLSPAQAALGGHAIAVFAPSPAMPLPTPTPGYVPRPALVSGVLRILVVAAYFTDVNYTVSTNTLKQEFFGPTNSWYSYYQEISYGSVTLQGDVIGWYKLPYPEAHYGHDCTSIDDADCSGSDQSWQIANDAALAAQTTGLIVGDTPAHGAPTTSVNFNNYDYFVFVHSGYGEESSGVKDDVWSVTYLGGVYVRTNTRTLTKFQIVPELEAGGAVPMGVYCHEFGHQLGLPDLYNTVNGKTIMGPWELMDKGLWNGDPAGSSPAHMGAWDKLQLGFVSGSMVTTALPGATNTYTIDPTEVASSNTHVVEVPLTSTSSPSQYYLIEVRAAIGFDSALPAAGVLISYVDNTAIVGRIHIMDGHPSVPALEDAVWSVGQTFTDNRNNIAVTVTGKVGNAYQVTVNRGGAPPPPIQNQTSYIDLAISSVNSQPAVITSPNTNVTVTLQISNLGTGDATNAQVQVKLDGSVYTNLQVSVGAGASTQSTFTWLSTVGSHQFQITIDPNHLINDTNRANNVATFNLNVGPTLTINVPLNVTTNSTIWVAINGIKYNVTSGQLQTSVPTGNVTVQVQPVVNSTQGVRAQFSGWSDGSLANPRKITITTNTDLKAVFATEYLLSISANGGATSQSAWYRPETIAVVTATNPSNVTANSSRLIFNGWSGDLTSNATQLQVNMTKPESLSANWITQYYVTIVSPTGSPTGSGWYNAGQIATVGVQSSVQYSNGTRLVFTGWNSTTVGKNPSAQITVNSPTTLQAGWRTQYLISIQSSYGGPQGAGWYDAGSNVKIYIQREIDYPNSTRRIFAGWTGDYAGAASNATLHLNTPKTLNANWNTEYLITFKVNGIPNSTVVQMNLNNVTYDLSVNSGYQAWYKKGTTISPVLNQTVLDGYMVHKFSGWTNATGGPIIGALTVKTPSTYVASYSTDYSLPPIPGFPIEAVLIGILLGFAVLLITRKRHHSNKGVS